MGVLESNNNCFYSSYDEDYYYLYSDHIDYSNNVFESINKYLLKNKCNTVIDACCCTGIDVEYFLNKKYLVDGSDICKEMVEMTKKRIKHFSTSSNIFQCDVLDLAKTADDKKYDLVLFRGNTLGHLNQQEQIEALTNLLGVVKKGGFLLFDFRIGEIYFKQKRKFELRGQGLERNNFYYSYYKLNYPKSINEYYNITAFTYLFNYKSLKYRKLKRNILANFVLKEKIDFFLSKSKNKVVWKQNSNEGLKHLQTYLIQKI